MLCKNRNVGSLVASCINLANILKLSNLSIAPLQEKSNVSNLDRLNICRAVVRILADLRSSWSDRAIISGCQNVLAARCPNGQHSRCRYVTNVIHLVRRNGVNQSIVGVGSCMKV